MRAKFSGALKEGIIHNMRGWLEFSISERLRKRHARDKEGNWLRRAYRCAKFCNL